MSPLSKTVFELTCGCAIAPERVRYFGPTESNDAAQRFAEHVASLARNEGVTAAYVILKRLPDSINPEGVTLMAWTKVGGETLSDGRKTLEELLS